MSTVLAVRQTTVSIGTLTLLDNISDVMAHFRSTSKTMLYLVEDICHEPSRLATDSPLKDPFKLRSEHRKIWKKKH